MIKVENIILAVQNNKHHKDIKSMIMECSRRELIRSPQYTDPLLLVLIEYGLLSLVKLLLKFRATKHLGRAFDEILKLNEKAYNNYDRDLQKDTLEIASLMVKYGLGMDYYLIKIPYFNGKITQLKLLAKQIAKRDVNKVYYGDMISGYILSCIRQNKEFMLEPFIELKYIDNIDFDNAIQQARYIKDTERCILMKYKKLKIIIFLNGFDL